MGAAGCVIADTATTFSASLDNFWIASGTRLQPGCALARRKPIWTVAVAQLAPDQSVDVIRQDGDWFQVRYQVGGQSREGWTHKVNVDLTIGKRRDYPLPSSFLLLDPLQYFTDLPLGILGGEVGGSRTQYDTKIYRAA